MFHSPTLVAILASALLLTGCFDKQQPAAAGADGLRIRLAMLLPPRSALSPFSDDAFKLSRWRTGETLVVLDANGDAQPALATRWQQLDELTWRFTLRDGVKFHDGSDFTAGAVVKALTAAMHAAPKPRILDGVTLNVTEDDPHTVRITTTTRDPLLPQRLSSPQLTILSPAAYGANGVVSPIRTGTGPFVLTQLNGTSSARLDRFDGYWGNKAAAPGIDVDFVPDSAARTAALRTGAADLVEAIPVSQAPLLDPGLVHEVPMPRTNTLYLNTRRGAFSNPALRAAARDAIQRDILVKKRLRKPRRCGEWAVRPGDSMGGSVAPASQRPCRHLSPERCNHHAGDIQRPGGVTGSRGLSGTTVDRRRLHRETRSPRILADRSGCVSRPFRRLYLVSRHGIGFRRSGRLSV